MKKREGVIREKEEGVEVDEGGLGRQAVKSAKEIKDQRQEERKQRRGVNY